MSVATQIEGVPHAVMKTPFLAIGIGLLMLIIVLAIEAYKPGLLTGPIKHLLGVIGIGTGT